MNPEDNPIHYCYGCQYCFAELIDLDSYDDITEDDIDEEPA
jgi:hypothetical protein